MTWNFVHNPRKKFATRYQEYGQTDKPQIPWVVNNSPAKRQFGTPSVPTSVSTKGRYEYFIMFLFKTKWDGWNELFHGHFLLYLSKFIIDYHPSVTCWEYRFMTSRHQTIIRTLQESKVKTKQYITKPGQASSLPRFWESHVSKQSTREGGNVVNPKHWLPITPPPLPGYIPSTQLL